MLRVIHAQIENLKQLRQLKWSSLILLNFTNKTADLQNQHNFSQNHSSKISLMTCNFRSHPGRVAKLLIKEDPLVATYGKLPLKNFKVV